MIKITGISTPVGSINWEYKDDDSSLAIMYIAVLLESKRLLTMPWSRVYCHLPFELDVKYCVQSALQLKDTIPVVLNSHKVLPAILLTMNEIIHALNDFLNDVALVQNSSMLLDQSSQQQKFQGMVKQLQEKVEKTMKSFLKDMSQHKPLDMWRILKQ